jgi:mono/diheme cytochrome c family protein
MFKRIIGLIFCFILSLTGSQNLLAQQLPLFSEYMFNTLEINPPRYSHALTMPPSRFRQLTDEQIDKLVQYLAAKKSKR